MKKTWAWIRTLSWLLHPLCFTLYPSLFLYSHNLHELSFLDIIKPLFFSLAIMMLVLSLLLLMTRQPHRAALLTSLLAVSIFFYQPYYLALQYVQSWLMLVGRPRNFSLIVWGMLWLASTIFIATGKRNFQRITFIVNSMALTLILFPLVMIGSHYLLRGPLQSTTRPFPAHSSEVTAAKNDLLPDIYYIIVDGYARNDLLRESYAFDNGPFLDYLRAKGFFIADKSRSNYAMTMLSLASSLNMQYLDHLPRVMGKHSADMRIPKEMIYNNKVSRLLKQEGYTIVHFESGFAATNRNRYADRVIATGSIDEFSLLLFKSTLFSYFAEKYGVIANRMAYRILKTFNELEKMPRIKGPKFVFAHIVSPHPPFLFNKEGRLYSATDLSYQATHASFQKRYVEQLQFINSRLIHLVDTLLQGPPAAPLIILQADHGPASWSEARLKKDCSAKEMADRMKIFNAYFLPGKKGMPLYPSITPVNSFRILFERYFSKENSLLEDRSYYSPGLSPFSFIRTGE